MILRFFEVHAEWSGWDAFLPMGTILIWQGKYMGGRSPGEIGDRDRNPVLMLRVLGRGNREVPVDLGHLTEITVREALSMNNDAVFQHIEIPS